MSKENIKDIAPTKLRNLSDAVLLAGLWITGRDGKMLTYGALVLACATSHAVGQRLWRK